MICRPTFAVAAVAFIAFSFGCESDARHSPSAPSTTAATTGQPTLETFSGTWTSALATGSATPALPNGCSQFDYTVTPVAGTQSASVDFAATCASISVLGKGTATLSGSMLAWGAEGTITLGTAPVCPFKFSDSTATPEGDGIRIAYSGTVCGVAVSGSELLRKRT
jgi:hypothetical protein